MSINAVIGGPSPPGTQLKKPIMNLVATNVGNVVHSPSAKFSTLDVERVMTRMVLRPYRSVILPQ